MSQIASKADVVLWDSPPLLSAADAALLAPLADGVVFIVERAQTQQAAVQAACQQLVDLHAKLIGVIVNRAQQDSRHPYYYQRLLTGAWWANLLKDVRSGYLDYQGKKIFHRKMK
jgi:Mrp family chromosome partitioning ATPase